MRDDSPYFWHFARFRDVFRSPLSPEFRGGDGEILVGEQVMLALLGLAATFAFVFLLLPLWATRSVWREMRCKGPAALCFAGLGAGFMLLEVSLLQRFTLFLGYPTYSLSVTLFALLLFSGLGSLASGRLAARGDSAVLASLAGIALVLCVHAFAAPRIFDALGGVALPVRVLTAVALIAPLGLCLGTFMPLALGRIASLGSHEREYVAWAWALNGFFSVIASIASTILAMLIGFTLLLGVAFAIYVAATLALLSIRTPRVGAPRRSP